MSETKIHTVILVHEVSATPQPKQATGNVATFIRNR